VKTYGLVERLRNGGQPDLAKQAQDLCDQLQRVTFLLNSSRLVITDPEARAIAGEAVSIARATLASVRSQP
jgi:hypothetical protein